MSLQYCDDGTPWLVHSEGPRRKLSRAISGGCDDWSLFTNPATGAQYVAYQSGFGPQYDVAVVLTPPVEEPQTRTSWQCRLVVPNTTGYTGALMDSTPPDTGARSPGIDLEASLDAEAAKEETDTKPPAKTQRCSDE